MTPAHDVNDYDLGVKHNLETINTINANGTMSAEAGQYEGMDRFDVRKQIAKDLDATGNLVKVEDYTNKVYWKRAYRCRYRTKTFTSVVYVNGKAC